MKRTILSLLALCALTISGCDDTTDSLTNGQTRGASRSPAGGTGESGDFSHSEGASAPGSDELPVDPAQVRAVGSPEVTSRLHGCGKMSIESMRQLLESRGFGGKGQRPAKTASGADIFNAGDTAPALGAANYGGRVPEAPFASTSAISKMFDIFTMSSYDATAPDWTAPACPGVKLLDAGKFTKDGLSCLMGKPASEEHLALANDAIVKNPTDGAKIAIAALLSAAHTCQ